MELRHPSIVDAEEYVVDPFSFERKDVMKAMVGPILDECLRPLYEKEITEEESDQYLDISATRSPYLLSFTEAVCDLMQARINRDGAYDKLDLLQEMNIASAPLSGYPAPPNTGDRDGALFYHSSIASVVREGTRSGVITPINIARQIHDIETSYVDIELLGRFSVEEARCLREILARDQTEKILIALTKGPNGFLGTDSNQLSWRDNELFFDFGINYKKAYKLEEGKVIGLSDEYYLAAENKREKLRSTNNRGALSSSGCPVRHSFENESGEKNEPLVITAKNFVIRAFELV